MIRRAATEKQGRVQPLRSNTTNLFSGAGIYEDPYVKTDNNVYKNIKEYNVKLPSIHSMKEKDLSKITEKMSGECNKYKLTPEQLDRVKKGEKFERINGEIIFGGQK